MTPAGETTSLEQVGSGNPSGVTSIRAVASAADPSPDAINEADHQRRLLHLARERFRVTIDAESPRRAEMLIDQNFRAGEQWDKWARDQRTAQGRPCLTENRIPGFLKHVLNNMRQARPEVKVDPIGDGADEEVAEIRQGLIRHIQVHSRAEIAFDTAFESMCTMGLGFFRVVDDWADPMSFDKDLFIEWVPNAFSVYFDPGARKPDWSDAKFCFVVEDISLAEFRQRFGTEFSAASAANFQSIGDHAPNWMPGGKVRIAEYFHIEEEDDTLCELADGTTVLFSKLKAAAADSQAEQQEAGSSAGEAQPDTGPQAPQIIRTRPVKVPYVMWSLISGVDVLKERRWAGRYIPIIPVIGNQIDLDGERILVGMVRFAREAQRMFNYMYSCFVEAIALVPKAPWIAEFSQIEEFKHLWERAHTDLQAFLPYRNQSAANGSPLPAPQRQQAEPPIQAFVEGLKLADNNLKSAFSIFDASLGERGPQESGLAINSRKVESELATYDWIDNFNRSIAYLGIVLDDLLPHYYNTPGRIVQIVREDSSSKLITLNQAHQNEDGEDKLFDLSQGKYATTISSGPSALTRRQESAKAMVETAKYYPQLWQVAGPLIVKAMDWPEKDAIAAQLNKALPPELRIEDPDQKNKVDPQQEAMKSQQLQQMVQQLGQLLEQATAENTKEQRKEEWATLREAMKQETSVVVADLKNVSQESTMLAHRVFDRMERMEQAMQQLALAAANPQPGQTAAPGSPPSSAPSEPQAPAPPISETGPPAPGGPPAG